MLVSVLIFFLLTSVRSSASTDAAPAPPEFVRLLPPPGPMYYSSPPPPHHLHRRKSYPPPPHHHHEAMEPPPPMFYRSPPPPSPPYNHHHHPPPPCYPLELSYLTSMKLVIQGRVVFKDKDVIKNLEDARVRVQCWLEDSVKEAYGRTDENGTFKLMVSGLELGKVNVSKCGVQVVENKVVKTSHLAFKFISTKEIVLEAADIMY